MSGTATVLVVDDDHDLRDAVTTVLEEGGFEAVAACNGREALDLLRNQERPPDAILLDLMMPIMDGVQFREAQLADPALSKIPVIVMTAHGRSPRELMQASGFLRKPFAAGALLLMLARLGLEPQLA
jgi:CheY-like chemotaxis protein